MSLQLEKVCCGQQAVYLCLQKYIEVTWHILFLTCILLRNGFALNIQHLLFSAQHCLQNAFLAPIVHIQNKIAPNVTIFNEQITFHQVSALALAGCYSQVVAAPPFGHQLTQLVDHTCFKLTEGSLLALVWLSKKQGALSIWSVCPQQHVSCFFCCPPPPLLHLVMYGMTLMVMLLALFIREIALSWANITAAVTWLPAFSCYPWENQGTPLNRAILPFSIFNLLNKTHSLKISIVFLEFNGPDRITNMEHTNNCL